MFNYSYYSNSLMDTYNFIKYVHHNSLLRSKYFKSILIFIILIVKKNEKTNLRRLKLSTKLFTN